MEPIKVFADEDLPDDCVKQVVYAENQPEYIPLPAARLPNGEIATRWKLTEEELEIVKQTGEIYLCISTFNQPLQPVQFMVDKPGIGYDESGRPFFYSPLWWKNELAKAAQEGTE